MGAKCKECGTDNGITMYANKTCKTCGKRLFSDESFNKFLRGNVQTKSSEVSDE